MSEQIYLVTGYSGEEYDLQFSESNDDWACLCTRLHTQDTEDGRLESATIRSLALLGAAVVLASRDDSALTSTLLPDGVPEWIRQEIIDTIPERGATK